MLWGFECVCVVSAWSQVALLTHCVCMCLLFYPSISRVVGIFTVLTLWEYLANPQKEKLQLLLKQNKPNQCKDFILFTEVRVHGKCRQFTLCMYMLPCFIPLYSQHVLRIYSMTVLTWWLVAMSKTMLFFLHIFPHNFQIFALFWCVLVP